MPDSSILGHTEYSETICSPQDYRRLILKQKLMELLEREKPNKIFCPLGIGGHIDHRMVREVCLELYKPNDHSLIFYEDLPYASHYSLNQIQSIIKKAANLNLYASYIDITKIWNKKKKGINCYKSQITSVMLKKIKNYALSLSLDKALYERIWYVK